jgi:hypothetical protein
VPKVSPRESFCLGLHLSLALAKHLPIFEGSSQFYGVISDLSHTRELLEMQENRPIKVSRKDPRGFIHF